MSDTQQKTPAFIAYTVRNDGEGDDHKSYWDRVGVAWPHAGSEGYTVEINAFPLDGRIVLRKPKALTAE